MKQQTLKSPVHFEGIGIHSGQNCSITINPAPENFGICFKRNDNDAMIPAVPQYLAHTLRATALEKDGVLIKTPEHILAALAGLTIHNALIEVSSEEMPIMDGSSLPFVAALKKAGTYTQDSDISPIQLNETLIIQENDSTLIAIPSEKPSFTYHLHLKENWIGAQTIHFDPQKDDFESAIAPARTFGSLSEINYLKKNGLALGGSLENALVLGESDYVNPTRFSDELARHKLLDLMGDCWIVGRPIQATIIGIKSGHALTMKLVQAISKTPSYLKIEDTRKSLLKT